MCVRVGSRFCWTMNAVDSDHHPWWMVVVVVVYCVYVRVWLGGVRMVCHDVPPLTHALSKTVCTGQGGQW